MNNYALLDWDTDFFGYPVGNITASSLQPSELSALMKNAKANHVRVLYWMVEPNDVDSNTLALEAGGYLADKKVTYVCDLSTLPADKPQQLTMVHEYTNENTSTELYDLAIQAGMYSRFKCDPKFDEKAFENMYKIWIDRSVKKEIADAVLVIEDNKVVVGLATVGTKNDRGDIGLVAVDTHYRGKGYGLALIQAAQYWFVDHGYTVSQVVTQGDNTGACGLYEKAGYSIESTKNVYHIWIENQG